MASPVHALIAARIRGGTVTFESEPHSQPSRSKYTTELLWENL